MELQTFGTGKATAGGAANHNADTWTESDDQKSGNSDLQIEVNGMQNTQRGDKDINTLTKHEKVLQGGRE